MRAEIDPLIYVDGAYGSAVTERPVPGFAPGGQITTARLRRWPFRHPGSPIPPRYDGRMPYRRCGRCGLDLPAISLGLWQNFGGADVFETGRAILRHAFDHGVTHFDLANNYGPPYGSAEENFGHVHGARLPPLSRRADHLDQGRLGHVAGPLWRRRRQRANI